MNTSPTKWLSLSFRKQQSTRANTSTDYCLFTNVCALRQQVLKKSLDFSSHYIFHTKWFG